MEREKRIEGILTHFERQYRDGRQHTDRRRDVEIMVVMLIV